MNFYVLMLAFSFFLATPAHALSVTEVLDLAAERRDPHDDDFEPAYLQISELAGEVRPRYTVNEDRHGERATGNPMASKLPTNAEALFYETLPVMDGRGRISWWAVEARDEKCVYHRYQGANGEVHWNGASQRMGGGLAIRMGDVPRAMRTLLSSYGRCSN